MNITYGPSLAPLLVDIMKKSVNKQLFTVLFIQGTNFNQKIILKCVNLFFFRLIKFVYFFIDLREIFNQNRKFFYKKYNKIVYEKYMIDKKYVV